LVEALPLERDAQRPPLFQTMFVLAGTSAMPTEAPAGAGGDAWPHLPVNLAFARYDLTLVASDLGGDGVEITVDYAEEVFSHPSAENILHQFVTLAAAVARDPDLPTADAPLLDAESLGAVLRAATGAAEPALASVPAHRWVEAQAARTPDADALVLGDVVLSYGEMNARANRLARRLVALGVAPEERVGIVADRSVEAVVALLAVLKAGGAYVPLDPAAPAARGAETVRDAGIRRVLGLAAHADAVRSWGAAPVDADGAGDAAELAADAADLLVDVHPGQLAYVIYTSGSTGTPKGVMVRHGALASLAGGFVAAHGFGPGERVLVVPPLSFDASVGDVFPALVSGAALVLHPDPATLTADALLDVCRQQGVTMVDTAAALWGLWADDLARRPAPVDPAPLRMVMMGGEAAALERVAAFARATRGAVALVNHYGPTEATVCATLQKTVDGAAWRGMSASIPIGRPLPNARAYVLDGRGHPVADGVRGELCLGGEGVARGYLGRPGLTAERFVPDPFADTPGARMYRTGDRVRRLADGALEYLGRTDHQIKLRGYRIEPGEVEAALLALPAVREALVMVREDEPGRRRLVAYLGTSAAPSASDLREALRARLPEYMVPSAFVALDALPMTAHGKVDRRALPVPPAAGEDDRFVAPRTETERALAALWAEVLGTARVGAEDDFFELGGHSLLALPLVNRVVEAFGVDVPLRALFTAPTVARMAAAIDATLAGGEAETPLPPEMADDLRLADGLRPDAPYVPGPLRHVFLTGATGFLGAYVLDGLLRRTEADVYCLVRAADADDGRRRIAENVAKYLEWNPAWDARIVPVVGDLGEPGLGMTEARFRAVGAQVDAIVHNGGVVNFTLPYGRMRGANVLGTLEVLRLACAGRAKPVHFVSTLGVYLTPDTRGMEIGEDTPLPDPARLHDAYSQTKWAADALVRKVAEAGVPVTLHRPARVGPDSRTGATNADDWFARLLRGFAQTGEAPDLGWWLDLGPVDQVAAGVVQAAADPAWLGGVFHYLNTAFLPFGELLRAVRAAGYPLRVLPYAEWRPRALAASADPAHPLHPIMPLFPAELVASTVPQFRSPRAEALMAAAGVAWTPADAALVARTITRFVHRGVLPAPADAPNPQGTA
jgi:amino acid adenylation domain-containing protein/thioester reductase-like protein